MVQGLVLSAVVLAASEVVVSETVVVSLLLTVGVDELTVVSLDGVVVLLV